MNHECNKCHDTGKKSRLKTANHILTDTPAWCYCDCRNGKALANGEKVDTVTDYPRWDYLAQGDYDF